MGCGSFYHTQSVVTAIIEIVVSTFSLLLISLTTFVVMNFKEDILVELKSLSANSNYTYTEFISFLESPVEDRVSILLLPVLYFIGEMFLAVFLLHSIKEKNYKRLRVWLTITGTLTLTGLCLFTVLVIRLWHSPSFYIIYSINLLFTLYSIWVVFALARLYKIDDNKGYRSVRTPQTDCFGKLIV